MDLTATIMKAAEPLLSGRGLGKSYGALRVLHDVEFNVFSGEVLGVLGPNGAGKTTLFNLISGDARLDAGAANLRWRHASERSASQTLPAGHRADLSDPKAL